jgi:acetyltransferase EpsM
MTCAVPLVVIGGGEHARAVIEAARSRPSEWDVLGFIDPAPCPVTRERLAVRHLGTDEDCFRLLSDRPNLRLVLGVGTIGVSPLRKQIVARYSAATERWSAVIHGHAWISPSARIGAGTVVMAGAVVNACASVGEHCVINTGSVIEHDVVMKQFGQTGPSATVGGGAEIGDGSYLGLGCRVRDHVTLGVEVMVAMGAVVVASVADRQTVVGIPARALR